MLSEIRASAQCCRRTGNSEETVNGVGAYKGAAKPRPHQPERGAARHNLHRRGGGVAEGGGAGGGDVLQRQRQRFGAFLVAVAVEVQHDGAARRARRDGGAPLAAVENVGASGVLVYRCRHAARCVVLHDAEVVVDDDIARRHAAVQRNREVGVGGLARRRRVGRQRGRHRVARFNHHLNARHRAQFNAAGRRRLRQCQRQPLFALVEVVVGYPQREGARALDSQRQRRGRGHRQVLPADGGDGDIGGGGVAGGVAAEGDDDGGAAALRRACYADGEGLR